MCFMALFLLQYHILIQLFPILKWCNQHDLKQCFITTRHTCLQVLKHACFILHLAVSQAMLNKLFKISHISQHYLHVFLWFCSIFLAFKTDTELNALNRCISNSLMKGRTFLERNFPGAMFGWILLNAFRSCSTLHRNHELLINTRTRQFRCLSENPFKRRETVLVVNHILLCKFVCQKAYW